MGRIEELPKAYLLALKCEYYCEKFDRTLPGYFETKERGGAWHPNRMGLSLRHAKCQQMSVTNAEEDVFWEDIRKYIPEIQRRSYEWLCEEYARHYETNNAKE